MATIARPQRLDDPEDDMRLLAIAVVRSATDAGQRVRLEDAAARFGIDLNDLDHTVGEVAVEEP